MTKLIYIFLLSFLLVGCSQKSEEVNTDIEVQNQIVEANNIINETFNNQEEIETYDEVTSNKINLNQEGITFLGNGISVKDKTVTISNGGTYIVTGEMSDGNIIVNAGDKDDVQLVFDNVKLASTKSSPIKVINAKQVTITLKEGSKNYIEDTSDYSLENNEEFDSAIFSKDDLVINGEGELNVVANYNDAIKSKDKLSIMSGTININSVDDGLVGKDVVAIKNGIINITSAGDGIKATDEAGYIAIMNGQIKINSGADALQAEDKIVIDNGTFDIVTGGGSGNSSDKSENNMWGRWQPTTNVEEDSQSAKGIKAENNVTINNGTFNIDSSDDAIHSNNNIVISNGQIVINSGDDGIHADNLINIISGKITINKSYEGIEASNVVISGGEIYVVSKDDGINIAGGNDSSAISGRVGQNNFKELSTYKLEITGGTININAVGDGMDSNGNINITGGNITINGPTSNGNAAIDFDGTCNISGGNVIAISSAGMLQMPSTTSTQPSIKLTSKQKAGAQIEIKDKNNNILAKMTAEKDFEAIIVSLESFTKGEEYRVFINGEEIGKATADITTNSMGGGGNNRQNEKERNKKMGN